MCRLICAAVGTLLACIRPACVCRLIKDFEQEARTDGMPPAELATRKKGLVQQLNDFIAMKKERGANITAKQELIGTKRAPAVKDVNGEPQKLLLPRLGQKAGNWEHPSGWAAWREGLHEGAAWREQLHGGGCMEGTTAWRGLHGGNECMEGAADMCHQDLHSRS